MSCARFVSLAFFVGILCSGCEAADPPDSGKAKTQITIVVSPSGKVTTTVESTPLPDPPQEGGARTAPEDIASGSEPGTSNGDPDDPVDVSRTLANRRPSRPGIPGRRQPWFVWTADRPGRVGPEGIKRITLHVEEYLLGDCAANNPQRTCAIASIWIYGEEETESGKYRLKLTEKYTKVRIHPVRDRGPMRSLAFRADLPVRGPEGQEKPGDGTRSFLITGSHRGAGNRLDQRAVRVTTFTRMPHKEPTGEEIQDLFRQARELFGNGQLPDRLDRLGEFAEKFRRLLKASSGDCVDEPDDAYYYEEEYIEVMGEENDYDYYDDPNVGYPYEEYEYDEEP